MSKKSVKKNYLYNLIYEVVKIVLPIITTPYIARVLGAENVGIYGYVISISAYFVLLGSLGINYYGKREIAYVQDSRKKRSKLFWEIFLFRLIASAISLAIYCTAFVWNTNEYSVYYAILIFEIVANAIDISWFFQGIEDFRKTVIRNLIVKFSALICIFLFVHTVNDLKIYLLIYALSILLGYLSLWFYLPKYVDKISIKISHPLRHLRGSVALFIPQVAVQVYTVLDRTMIGTIISDKSEVGYYTQGERIIKLLMAIITSMGIVMLPRIAHRFSKGDKKSIQHYIYKSFNFVYLLSIPLCLGIISVSPAFVPIFFGAGYDRVVPIMRIISVVVILIGMSNVIGVQYLMPTKRQKEYTISVVAGAVVNFFANLLLIFRFGAIGAAIGTVIAETVVTSLQFYYVRKDFNIKKILSDTWQYLISGLIMFVACMLVGSVVQNNLWSIILQVICGGLVYSVALFLFKNKLFYEIIHSVIRITKIGRRS